MSRNCLDHFNLQPRKSDKMEGIHTLSAKAKSRTTSSLGNTFPLPLTKLKHTWMFNFFCEIFKFKMYSKWPEASHTHASVKCSHASVELT